LPVLRCNLCFGCLDLGRIRHAIHAWVVSSTFELDQFCLYLRAGHRLALSKRRNCRDSECNELKALELLQQAVLL
jgi:hypothetical protein